MNLFIIRPHSFVDLITNSSSELFILDTKKSVEAVKEVLVALTRLNTQRVMLSDKNERYIVSETALFSTVFLEPTVAEFTFDVNAYPDNRVLMEMLHSHHFSRHPIEEKCNDEWEQWERLHPRPETSDTKYYKMREEAENRIYLPWATFKRHQYRNVFLWAAEQNGVDLAPLGELKLDRCRWGRPPFENSIEGPAQRLIDAVDDALSWEYSFKKGDIFLRSADDNSIPYELMEDIESTFSCQSRHLG